MLLFLPFALIGLLTLFLLLLAASARALPLGAGLLAALTAAGAGASAPLAFALGTGVFLGLEAARGFAGARWHAGPPRWLLGAILAGPAALAGYSVGALFAAWLGIDGNALASATALIAAASAGRSLGVRSRGARSA